MTSRCRAVRAVRAAIVLLWWLVPAGAADAAVAAACNAKPVVTAQIECFLDAAQATGNAGACEAAEIEAVRFQCLTIYAERSSDPAPCSRIDTGATAEETLALRESCVAGVAIARGDATMCEGFATPALGDSCYLMLVVRAGADPALCDRIERDVMRRTCREPAAEHR